MTGVLVSLLGLSGFAVAAGSNNLSSSPTASEKISVGTLSIVASPVISVQGSSGGKEGPLEASALALMGGAYVVSGVVQGVGDIVEISLKGVGSSVKMTVKLSGKALSGASVVVGTSVQLVTHASGAIIVASGKVLGFIPVEGSEYLISQKPLAQ